MVDLPHPLRSLTRRPMRVAFGTVADRLPRVGRLSKQRGTHGAVAEAGHRRARAAGGDVAKSPATGHARPSVAVVLPRAPWATHPTGGAPAPERRKTAGGPGCATLRSP